MNTTLRLNTEQDMPIIGLGTWKLQGEEVKKAVRYALDVGYRHIDTADRYGNHRDIAEALEESTVPREEIFVTTKLWLTDLHRSDVYAACERSLRELRTDYVDLYLIHWPDRRVPFAETLGAMNNLKERGLVKAVGVSNFTIHHLEDALKTGVKISVNQVEFHPSFYQRELKEFCDKHGIVLTAYSPIAQGTELELPLIQELAKKYNRSPAQVILNWIMRKGIAAIPKATELAFLEDNLKSLQWDMEETDSERIDALHANNRILKPEFSDFDY